MTFNFAITKKLAPMLDKPILVAMVQLEAIQSKRHIRAQWKFEAKEFRVRDAQQHWLQLDQLDILIARF